MGFDTKEILFYDNENVYKVKLDVAVLNNGLKVAYDLKQIKKANSYLQYLPQKKNSTYKMAKMPLKLGVTSSYVDNIPQNQEKNQIK